MSGYVSGYVFGCMSGYELLKLPRQPEYCSNWPGPGYERHFLPTGVVWRITVVAGLGSLRCSQLARGRGPVEVVGSEKGEKVTEERILGRGFGCVKISIHNTTTTYTTTTTTNTIQTPPPPLPPDHKQNQPTDLCIEMVEQGP